MRTTIISTSKLRTHKIFGIAIMIALLVSILSISIIQVLSGRLMEGLLILPLWVYLGYKVISMLLSLKNISYDTSSVYYEKNGFEVQIPFEDIKNIEIKSLTGIYTINLYRPSQDGKEVSFKMSLWYPFNFKKQDAKVNKLRNLIDQYQRTLPDQHLEGLPSLRI